MMNEKINMTGIKKAIKADRSWTTLDCQLNETEPGRWYWEIEKTVDHHTRVPFPHKN